MFTPETRKTSRSTCGSDIAGEHMCSCFGRRVLGTHVRFRPKADLPSRRQARGLGLRLCPSQRGAACSTNACVRPHERFGDCGPPAQKKRFFRPSSSRHALTPSSTSMRSPRRTASQRSVRTATESISRRRHRISARWPSNAIAAVALLARSTQQEVGAHAVLRADTPAGRYAHAAVRLRELTDPRVCLLEHAAWPAV